jgi:hypothetical protein
MELLLIVVFAHGAITLLHASIKAQEDVTYHFSAVLDNC